MCNSVRIGHMKEAPVIEMSDERDESLHLMSAPLKLQHILSSARQRERLLFLLAEGYQSISGRHEQGKMRRAKRIAFKRIFRERAA